MNFRVYSLPRLSLMWPQGRHFLHGPHLTVMVTDLLSTLTDQKNHFSSAKFTVWNTDIGRLRSVGQGPWGWTVHVLLLPREIKNWLLCVLQSCTKLVGLTTVIYNGSGFNVAKYLEGLTPPLAGERAAGSRAGGAHRSWLLEQPTPLYSMHGRQGIREALTSQQCTSPVRDHLLKSRG